MASLLFISAILGVSTVNAVSVVANGKSEKQSVVRRENQAMHLQASGNMLMHSDHQDTPEALLKSQPMGQVEVITECNRQFLMGEEGSDACPDSSSSKPSMTIRDKTDCKRAAEELKLTVAEDPNFWLSTHQTNPLPYPFGCYLNTSTNVVAFNPSESNSSTLEGKKICMRTLYTNGTEGGDRVDAEANCGDVGAESIMTAEGCWKASKCVGGGGVCRLLDFKENNTDFMTHDKPKGCYKDNIGCWGFNHQNATVVEGPIVNGTSVCLEKGTAEAGAEAAEAGAATTF